MKTQTLLRFLPDVYNKEPGSNNEKLLSLESEMSEEFMADADKVLEYLDIRKATGKTLDLFGASVQQPRGRLTDEQYRYAILNRIAMNASKGDMNSVISNLAIVFDCDGSEFHLVEVEGTHCTVTMEKLPLQILINAGLTIGQTTQMISKLLPVGVKLLPFEMSGTFEFAATADEASKTAGFADDDRTYGGYLGAMSTDDVAVPL